MRASLRGSGGTLPARPNGPREAADYDVGYGKPPPEHRFRKGSSGNPRGRPKGSKNRRPAMHEDRLRGIILDEAYRGIDIRDGDRTLTVPMVQAVMRAIAHNAVKGKHFSQRLFAQLVGEVENRNFEMNRQLFESAANYKLEWETELERRRRHGITGLPEPLPHPDHVILDMKTGTARIAGPSTREEKAIYERGLEIWLEYREEIPIFEGWLKRTRDERKKKSFRETIAVMRKTLKLLDSVLPPDMKAAALERERKRAEEARLVEGTEEEE